MVERLINPEDAHVHVSSQTRETETDSMRVARHPLKGSVFKAQCFAVRLAFTRDHQNLATPPLVCRQVQTWKSLEMPAYSITQGDGL